MIQFYIEFGLKIIFAIFLLVLGSDYINSDPEKYFKNEKLDIKYKHIIPKLMKSCFHIGITLIIFWVLVFIICQVVGIESSKKIWKLAEFGEAIIIVTMVGKEFLKKVDNKK